MKKIKKSVPFDKTMNDDIKDITNRLNISQSSFIVLATELLLESIKKGATTHSDLIKMILNEK